MQQVVKTDSLEALEARLDVLPRVPVYSTNTGRPFLAKTATQLLEQIIHEILTQAIQWKNVVDGVIQKAYDLEAIQVKLVVFRVSLAAQELVTAAKNKLSAETSTQIEEIIPWIHERAGKDNISGPRGPGQSSIAIVGMACRMPGGADSTDKFWDLLDAGLDVSRKIPADRFDVDTHFVSPFYNSLCHFITPHPLSLLRKQEQIRQNIDF